MARVWSVNESDCSKVNLLKSSDDHDEIWLENTWHEVSPTHAITMPSNKYMVDSNTNILKLLDGYCTTYFYKGWQTVYPLMNKKIGKIIHSGNWYYFTDDVGKEVAYVGRGTDSSGYNKYLQVVRLRDNIISLPDNMGKNLIPDLYPGSLWGNSNWYAQWGVTPLVPNDGQITVQYTTFPRTFTIDETYLPGNGNDSRQYYYAPELFAPYMYLSSIRKTDDNMYIGGLIVVIGVKKLS